MKRLAQLAAAPLRRTSLASGDRWAWWALLFVVGVGVGWVAAVEWVTSHYVCFPPA